MNLSHFEKIPGNILRYHAIGYGFYLANMPFKIKADVVLPDDIPGSSFAIRQVRLQFQNLSANQQDRLKDFIKKHGTGLGAPGVKD